MAISSNVFLVFGIHCNGREGRDRGGEFSRFLFSVPVDYLGQKIVREETTLISTELYKCKRWRIARIYEPRGLNPPIMWWWLCLYFKLHQSSYSGDAVQCSQCAIYSLCLFPDFRGKESDEKQKNCLYLAARGPTSLSNGQRLIHHSALIVCYSWKLMFWKNK